MKAVRSLVVVCFVALLTAAVVPAARADAIDKETIVRFSQPVEVPGTVLQAGQRYVFQLADTLGSPDVVEIWNAERTHLITTVVGIPAERMHATDKTKFTFERAGSASPEAIRTWFYPGELDGIQFVYPNARGVKEAHRMQPAVNNHKD